MAELSVAQKFAIWLLPVLFGITVHEVAHGWIARRLGDPTAMMLGRLTLNPIKHIDPVGTILVPGLLLLAPGSVIFGWAKPVPVTYENLRHPRRDMALVALAGPGANLLMAILWVLVAKLGVLYDQSFGWLASPLIYMGVAGVIINTILGILNLLPLPPLDGGRVLTGLLPPRLSAKVGRLEPYGFIIVLALLITGVLGMIILPALNIALESTSQLAGLDYLRLRSVLQALF